MIAKQIKGKSFRGCVSYVLSKEGAEMIHSNMLGETVDELSREFAQTRKLKPNLQKCVYHASLSLPEGESLNKDQWGEVSQKYMKEMGFSGSQYMAVMHKDTEHQHIHIVASRIRLDGTVVSDSNDYKRSEKVIRGFEIEYGLEKVKSSRDVGISAPTRGEMRKILNERNPSIKLRLQKIIGDAINEKQSMTSFMNKLESEGVGVIANISEKTGHISGISFVLDGELMKGSDLGKSFTWGKFKKKGIVYDNIKESKHVIEYGRRTREASLQQSHHQNERANARSSSGFKARGKESRHYDGKRFNQRSEGNKLSNYKYGESNLKFISELFKNDGEDRIFSNGHDERGSEFTFRKSKKESKKLSNNHNLDRPFGANSFTEDLFRNSKELLPSKELDSKFREESDELAELREKSPSDFQQERSDRNKADDRGRKEKLKDKKRRKAKSKKRGLDLDF